ncbi:MAG: hypothetical protein ABJF11_14200 [Reichenbachiella sp.]|uniref:hypothetical protein n=1 Tax=Reichenbachiella sp. TaxID=2184521 RepID=UPI003263B4D8
MKKQNIILLTLLWCLASCNEDPKVPIEDIFITFNTENNETDFTADGSTVVTLIAELPMNSDKQFRSVIFEADRGSFVENGEDEITKKAEVNVQDQVIAEVDFLLPTTPGDLNIYAQIELEDKRGRFVETLALNLTSSEPYSIKLTANSFSVENNYGNEIEISGVVANSAGNKVSEGVLVELEDTDASNVKLSGEFRDESLKTGSSSQISAKYTPGKITADQYIYVKAYVMHESGSRTSIKDSVRIYVKPN